MNRIKNIFKRAFNFVVKHYSAAVGFAASLIQPLVNRLTAPTITMPTLAEVLKAAAGVAIVVVLGNAVNAVSIVALAVLTTVFGILLPIAIANLLALALVVVGLVYFYVNVFDRLQGGVEFTFSFAK